MPMSVLGMKRHCKKARKAKTKRTLHSDQFELGRRHWMARIVRVEKEAE